MSSKPQFKVLAALLLIVSAVLLWWYTSLSPSFSEIVAEDTQKLLSTQGMKSFLGEIASVTRFGATFGELNIDQEMIELFKPHANAKFDVRYQVVCLRANELIDEKSELDQYILEISVLDHATQNKIYEVSRTYYRKKE